LINLFIKKFLYLIGIILSARLFFIFLIFSTTYFTPNFEKSTFNHIIPSGNSYDRSNDFNLWEKSKIAGDRGIILGSSTAYRNINTDTLSALTKINWFNLGSSSQTPSISLILLKNIEKSTPVKFILFDLNETIIELSPEESCRDLIQNSMFSAAIKFELFLLSPNTGTFDQLCFRLMKQISNGKIFIGEPDKADGKYLKNGSTFTQRKSISYKLDESKIETQIIKASEEINKIIKFCTEKKIDLYLNVAPVFGKKSLLKISYSKVIINDELFNSNNLFYDTYHMHGLGSILYTKNLASKINKFSIPNKK
jgi:hypothetical protein